MRLEKGLSLRALGDASDLSAQHIDKVERGVTNPSLTTIRRLADALNVSPADLLGD